MDNNSTTIKHDLMHLFIFISIWNKLKIYTELQRIILSVYLTQLYITMYERYWTNNYLSLDNGTEI
jgi:hypothetical protein